MTMERLYLELPQVLSFGWNSMNRLRQTAVALGRTGLEYALGSKQAPPVLLRQVFERLGATYIKIGQLIASSPSLFPEDYVREFQRCLDQTEPVSFRRMEKILKEELGPLYDRNVFSHIHHQPIASASIAQVYAARLVTGEEVVVKIQRPGVKTILTTDLNFLYYTALLMETLIPRLKHASLAGILSEIRRTVMEECDFVKEAENLETFAAFLKSTGNTHVVTPKVYYQASSSRVLTMERLRGIPLTDRDNFLRLIANPQQILIPAFETWMESISGCELFHADLHAGNLLILEDGRVGFIDFGIVGRISAQTQAAVQSLIQAMMTMNFPLMAESMLGIGMTRRKVDTDRLAKDLEAFYLGVESLAEGSADLSETNMPEPDQALLEIVRIAEVHGIRFPREFTLLMKQFLYFDAYRDMLFDMDRLEDMNMGELDRLMDEMIVKFKRTEWGDGDGSEEEVGE